MKLWPLADQSLIQFGYTQVWPQARVMFNHLKQSKAMLCPWICEDAREVIISGLRHIREGPWLKQILPHLNIRNVLEQYGGRINMLTELTEGFVQDKKKKKVCKGEKDLSQQQPRICDTHVITSECQRLLPCLIQLKIKGPGKTFQLGEQWYVTSPGQRR